MKREIFRGAATALVTPFCGGRVDFDSFGAIIDAQTDAGIDALVVCGTTGEPLTMTDEEKIETVRFAVKRAAGRVPVIVGAGSGDTARAIELCRGACEAGADALLIVTPYYNKTSQRGLIAHYTMIADSVSKPIILYNVPSRTGLNIAPETYAALADHPNIAGIKEASGNISAIADTAALVGDRLAIYSGNDDQITPIMALGAVGVISVLSNIMPRETKKICSLFFEGRVKESAALQLRLLPLIRALFSDVNPIPVKAAMAMLGYCREDMRMPLCPLEDGKRAHLRALLEKEGLLKKA